MTTTWTYRENIYRPDTNLQGFEVEATDGGIGTVDEDTTDTDHLIVDTGFWIFGKKRLLPAGVVAGIDYDEKRVYVGLTKDQIRHAPDLDADVDRSRADWTRSLYGPYYDPYGW
jgi:hypothetical protein